MEKLFNNYKKNIICPDCEFIHSGRLNAQNGQKLILTCHGCKKDFLVEVKLEATFLCSYFINAKFIKEIKDDIIKTKERDEFSNTQTE